MLILHPCSHTSSYYLKTTKMVKWHFSAESQDIHRTWYHWNFKGEELQNLFLPVEFWLVLHLWITSMSRFNKSTQIHNFRVNKRHKADQLIPMKLWFQTFFSNQKQKLFLEKTKQKTNKKPHKTFYSLFW